MRVKNTARRGPWRGTPAAAAETSGHRNYSMSPLAGQSPLFTAALSWLNFGVDLLPAQPGSKHLVAGFGPHQKHISHEDAARVWFSDKSCNLALVTGMPGGLVVLDCDSERAYAQVTSQCPGIRNTLTVRTRRGYHSYFLHTKSLKSGHVAEIELKADGACVITPPSVVAGHVYRWVNEDAPLAEFPAALSLLSEEKALSRESQPGGHAVSGDTISRVKAAWPVLDYARTLTRLSTRDGRWFHGLCPLHSESHPSFWLDAQRGLWGCYSCGGRGDVIDLFSMARGVTVPEAIKQMIEARGAP